MISVGLATYNGEKYLLKQLTSLLNQTMKIDEVLICDDCSSDETVTIIKKFIIENNLLNWKLLVNEVNLGYQKNFLNIMSKLNGDIIFLCDQDDIWELDKVEICYNILKSNPKIQLLSTSFRVIDNNDNFIKIKKNHNYSNNNLLKMKIDEGGLVHIPFKYLYTHENYAQGCCMCFTKVIKESYVHLNVDGIIHDLALNIIASVIESSYFVNYKGICYRIHDNNSVGYKVKNALSFKEKLDLNYRIKIYQQPLYFTKQESLFLKNNSNYFKCLKKEVFDFIDKKINFYEQRIDNLQSNKVFSYIKLYKSVFSNKFISKKVFIMDIIAMIFNKYK